MAELPIADLPSRCVQLRHWSLTSTAELHGLRASLTGALNASGEQLDDVLENVVLVASELATNAIRHGLPPTEVRLLHDGNHERYILDVTDHDLAHVPVVTEAAPTDAGGRGIKIAQLLAVAIGWYVTADVKHIWASFPAPGA